MQMVAELIFLEPDDVRPAVAELTELGFDCEVLHWTEPYSDAMWILARANTELDVDDFANWVESIVDGLGGDPLDAGASDAEIGLERKHRDNDRLDKR